MTATSIIGHFKELRKRFVSSAIAILIGFGVCFYLNVFIIDFLMVPFQNIQSSLGDQKMVINTVLEGFLLKLKLAFIVGIIISFPVHIYNVIRFTFPGLNAKEKKVIVFVLIFSFLLGGFGFYFSYYQLIPFSITFLTSTGFIPSNVGLLLNYKLTIQFVINFIVFALLLFQFPVILELLLAMNLVNRKALFRRSHYVVVGIFILTALVTPPDVISQIGMAVPLIILFFVTILIAKIFGWGKG